MRFFAAGALLLLAACGSGTPASSDGGGGADLARAPATCQTVADCRLYSSYCSTAPCQCFALGRNDPDPPCSGTQMSCIVDPCANARLACGGGHCILAP